MRLTDNLFRAYLPAVSFRSADDEESSPGTLYGHFARFGEWNEIDSALEGRFLERIHKGAFARTFRHKGTRMPVLFQHGFDPEVGDKVIASTTVLREDDHGPYFEARLLDGLPPLLLSGLRDGRYGTSYRFRIFREDWVDRPERSDHNPDGLPERTIKEAEVFEYGPVTFPADAQADIAVRSLTDAAIAPSLIRSLLSDPDRVEQMLAVRPDVLREDAALLSRALAVDPAPEHVDETRSEEDEPGPVHLPPVVRDPISASAYWNQKGNRR